jgi:hypothetical protein
MVVFDGLDEAINRKESLMLTNNHRRFTCLLLYVFVSYTGHINVKLMSCMQEEGEKEIESSARDPSPLTLTY